MNVRSSKPTALCRGSANALASPCASVKAILTAYSRTQGEVFFALDQCQSVGASMNQTRKGKAK